VTVERSRNPDVDPLLRTGLAAASSDAPAACLDAATLAAWFERTLPEADNARVDAHLAGCARCQAVVASLAATDNEAAAAAAPVIPLRRPQAWKWIVPATIGAAAALIWAVMPGRETPAPEVQMARAEPEVTQTPATPPAPIPFGGGGGAPAPAPAADAERSAAAPVARGERPAAEAKSIARAQAPLSQTKAEETPAAPDSASRDEAARGSTVGIGAQSAFPTMAAPPPPPAAPPRAAEPATVAPPTSTIVQGMPPANTPVPVYRREEAVAELQMPASNFASSLIEVTSRPAVPNAQETSAAPPPQAGAGRGGAARSAPLPQAGGGRSGAARSVVQEVSAPTETRWRVSNNTIVQRSFNGGRSWDVIPVDPPSRILAGDAPTPSICWFTGADGLILVTTDATRFTRIPFPERVNLTSVTATSATEAVVATSDGRSFRTSDGGRTWNVN